MWRLERMFALGEDARRLMDIALAVVHKRQRRGKDREARAQARAAEDPSLRHISFSFYDGAGM
eukprot:11202546-Lingulodinium_polyedra.AAC.1